MCARVCRCPDMCVGACVIRRGSKVRTGGEGGRRGRGGRGRRAKPGVNRHQRFGLEGGARVINLLSFVLSVCFHEALVVPKVKAVSLKIVCLLCSMFSPQG